MRKASSWNEKNDTGRPDDAEDGFKINGAFHRNGSSTSFTIVVHPIHLGAESLGLT